MFTERAISYTFGGPSTIMKSYFLIIGLLCVLYLQKFWFYPPSSINATVLINCHKQCHTMVNE